MRESTVIGWFSLSACGILTLALGIDFFVRNHRSFAFPLCAVLVLSHPGLWTSAYRGDCESGRRDGSTQYLILTGILYIGHLAYVTYRRHRLTQHD